MTFAPLIGGVADRVGDAGDRARAARAEDLERHDLRRLSAMPATPMPLFVACAIVPVTCDAMAVIVVGVRRVTDEVVRVDERQARRDRGAGGTSL